MEINGRRLLDADEIEVRVGQNFTEDWRKCGKGDKPAHQTLLLYKTARADMNVLDELYGPMNWKRKHEMKDGINYCTISIWDDSKKCWVEKEDCGTESQMEAEKGESSDAFKRAGVNWGIGRELYTGPRIMVDNIKPFYDVKEIGYDEKGNINRLVIVHKKDVVFEYGNASKKQEPKNEEQKPQQRQVNKLLPVEEIKKLDHSSAYCYNQCKKLLLSLYGFDENASMNTAQNKKATAECLDEIAKAFGDPKTITPDLFPEFYEFAIGVYEAGMGPENFKDDDINA